MKRCIFHVSLWLIIVVVTLSADLGSAHTIDVGDSMRTLIEADWTQRDRQFTTANALASHSSTRDSRKSNARGVTTAQDATGGCDGIKNGRWGFHTASGEQDAWWQVDLGKEYKLDRGHCISDPIHSRTCLARGPGPGIQANLPAQRADFLREKGKQIATGQFKR
ncbi:MAG: discoidin domain-containing protein [Planctomycetota bacterium]